MEAMVKFAATAALTFVGVAGVWQSFDAPGSSVRFHAGGASSSSVHRADSLELDERAPASAAIDAAAEIASSIDADGLKQRASAVTPAVGGRASSGGRATTSSADDTVHSFSACDPTLAAEPCPVERRIPLTLPSVRAGLNAQFQTDAGEAAGAAAAGGAVNLDMRVN